MTPQYRQLLLYVWTVSFGAAASLAVAGSIFCGPVLTFGLVILSGWCAETFTREPRK